MKTKKLSKEKAEHYKTNIKVELKYHYYGTTMTLPKESHPPKVLMEKQCTEQ